MDFETQEQSKEKGWKEKVTPEMNLKQFGNKVKMTAEQTKNKVMGYEDSLI